MPFSALLALVPKKAGGKHQMSAYVSDLRMMLPPYLRDRLEQALHNHD